MKCSSVALIPLASKEGGQGQCLVLGCISRKRVIVALHGSYQESTCSRKEGESLSLEERKKNE